MSDIYFIRHNFNNDVKIWEYCRSEQCIAIHFNGEGFDEFEKYSPEFQVPSFRKAFADFKYLSVHGGVLIVQYDPSSFQLGKIDPATPIGFYNYPDKGSTADNFYKTLKLSSVSPPYYYSQYPLLSALRPPYQTIAKMSSLVSNIYKHLTTGEKLELIVSNLHPKMLEVMCEEYLRSKLCDKNFRIMYALVKTGKTLPVIDIYAFTRKDQYLAMQVTHSSDPSKIKHKAEKLKSFLDEVAPYKSMLALFAAPQVHRELVESIGLHFLAIEDIISTMASHDRYRNLLKDLIGIVTSE